jgi:RNA polymerase sigma-70 factor (ECF subfamily)
MDELSVDDMLELTGISKTAYDTKRKLIRRRVDKAYPEGMRL